MTHGGKEVLKTVLGNPLTWVPFATASVVLAIFPWWVGILAETVAAVSVGVIWGSQLTRLTAIAEAMETKVATQANDAKTQTFLTALYKACPPASDLYKEMIGLSNEIIQTIKVNSWLDSFDYARNTMTLMGELRAEAEDMIANHTIPQRDQWKAHQKNFEDSRIALLDTKKTMQATIAENAKSGGAGRAQTVAQQIIKSNKTSARLFSDIRKGASPDELEKEKTT